MKSHVYRCISSCAALALAVCSALPAQATSIASEIPATPRRLMVAQHPGAPDAIAVNRSGAIASIGAGAVSRVVSAGITTTQDLAALAPGMLDVPFLAATRGVDALGSPIVTIVWSSMYEIRTWGYKVLRSETASRDGADVVSDGLFAANGSGGAYLWVDVAAPTAAAWYWIEEIDLDGVTTTDHGPVPVLTTVIHRAFLALIGR